MILIRFDFDLIWLDLAWIWLGFDSIRLDFGWIWLDFGSIWALGGPRRS